jgi:hypothetical protein
MDNENPYANKSYAERVRSFLRPTFLGGVSQKPQDSFPNGGQTTTYPTRTVQTVYPKGMQISGNPNWDQQQRERR